jgi:hypothetical protein
LWWKNGLGFPGTGQYPSQEHQNPNHTRRPYYF